MDALVQQGQAARPVQPDPAIRLGPGGDGDQIGQTGQRGGALGLCARAAGARGPRPHHRVIAAVHLAQQRRCLLSQRADDAAGLALVGADLAVQAADQRQTRVQCAGQRAARRGRRRIGRHRGRARRHIGQRRRQQIAAAGAAQLALGPVQPPGQRRAVAGGAGGGQQLAFGIVIGHPLRHARVHPGNPPGGHGGGGGQRLARRARHPGIGDIGRRHLHPRLRRAQPGACGGQYLVQAHGV